MATSNNNVITYGLSGKVGDLIVFKQQNGKTIVGKMPIKSSKPPTVAQVNVNERFKFASKYAKQAIKDPVLKAKYASFAKTGQSVFNVAFADFFTPPVLTDALGVYNGEVGCVLTVKAIDNYEVKTCKLAVYLANETLLEEGEAVLQTDGVTWKYNCTTSNTEFATCTLKWSTTDLANNNTLLEIIS